MRDGHSSIVFSRALVVGIAVLGIVAGAAAAGCASPSTDDDVGSGAGSAVSTGGAFLPAEQVADLVTIAPAFPFGVVARHAANGPALDARWGRHGGPLVTTQDLSHPGSPQKVARWTLPAGVTDAASRTDLTAVIAPNLPAQTFWGVDGFVDLPFDSLAMQAYSSTGDGFPGELLFYSQSYDAVVARAQTHGFYSGVGIADGSAKRIVYSGLSGLGPDAAVSQDSGLFGSDVCQGSPAPSGSCAASVKLFGWPGNSGPVTVDADGNVFVGAFVTSAAGETETDTIYALSKTQSLAPAAQQAATLSQRKTGGTASIAAISTPGSQKGWVIAKGHDDKTAAPSYAVPYSSAGGQLTTLGAVVEQAVVGSSPDASLSFFADPKGHLWVAVELPSGSTFLEIAPRP
jgi:hypothetical protein